jgi:hypothetical protein
MHPVQRREGVNHAQPIVRRPKPEDRRCARRRSGKQLALPLARQAAKKRSEQLPDNPERRVALKLTAAPREHEIAPLYTALGSHTNQRALTDPRRPMEHQ